MKLYKVIGLASLLFLAACGQKKNDKQPEEAQQQEAHQEGNNVSLTDEQKKAANIQLGKVEMKNLTTSISVNGTLVVPNQNKAVLTSLSGGILKTLLVQPGEYVRKGQVIGTVVNTELSALQQQLISINAQLKFSEQELTRQKELVAGNAAPLKNVQRTEAEYNGLKAQQNALKRQLSALGVSSSGAISSTLSITAPISGNISEISAQIGSQIDAATPIAQIINNSELHLDLFVYEKDLPKVATGQRIHFTLTNNPSKEYDAEVFSIGTAFANASKTIPIHAKVVNEKANLIDGMGVTARISIGDQVYPSVPDGALVNSGSNDYIFIVSANQQNKDEHEGPGTVFERVQVVKGASDIGYTQITPVSPIPDNATIVTQGAFFLMAKMTNVGEHEH